jgi:hypothetical protein
VLNTPPCLGPESLELATASSLLCKSGAIAGCVARAGGGVEVGGAEASVGDPESPLHATAATKARLSTMPNIILRIDLDPEFNLFFPVYPKLFAGIWRLSISYRFGASTVFHSNVLMQ